jgi:hypothetical protein
VPGAVLVVRSFVVPDEALHLVPGPPLRHPARENIEPFIPEELLR